MSENLKPDQTPELDAALLAAQREAKGVQKTSENTFHHYKYAASDDVVIECREILHRYAITVSPLTQLITGDFSNEHPYGMLHVEYEVKHAISGQASIRKSETPVVPEKGRPPDKAAAGAKTLDLSYFLRGLLLLPRVDEFANVDGRDDTGWVPQKEKKEIDKERRDWAKKPVTEEAKKARFAKLLKQLNDAHGGQICAQLTEGMPRETADDYERMYKAIHSQLGSHAVPGKPPDLTEAGKLKALIHVYATTHSKSFAESEEALKGLDYAAARKLALEQPWDKPKES